MQIPRIREINFFQQWFASFGIHPFTPQTEPLRWKAWNCGDERASRNRWTQMNTGPMWSGLLWCFCCYPKKHSQLLLWWLQPWTHGRDIQVMSLSVVTLVIVWIFSIFSENQKRTCESLLLSGLLLVVAARVMTYWDTFCSPVSCLSDSTTWPGKWLGQSGLLRTSGFWM